MSVEYLQFIHGPTPSTSSLLPPNQTINAYFEAMRVSDSLSGRSYESSVQIQRRWRGYRDRKYLQFINAQATHIQRVYRGYRGRIRFALELRERELAIHKSLFDSMAIKIQKLIRGYLSRKFTQDVYARRDYIRVVDQRGDALDRAADDELERQIIRNSEETLQARAEKFEHLTSNIHHLVGTRAIPSIFQSRLGPEYDTTAFDIPMEHHIREAFQNRQTQLRKMRQQIFHTTNTNSTPAIELHRSQNTSSTPVKSSSPSHHHVPVSPSPPLASPSSLRSSSSNGRVSRPSSSTRLAPIQATNSHTTARPLTGESVALSTFNTVASSPSLSSSASPLPPLAATVAIRSAGRAPLNSKTTAPGKAYESEEEKQQVPLALALGGHSSTPISAASNHKDFAQTMNRTTIQPSPPITSPTRKWEKPIKPSAQRING